MVTIETAMQRIADEFRAASEYRQRIILRPSRMLISIILSESKAVEGLVAGRQLAVSFLDLNMSKTPCFHVENAGIATK
ncbi:uncharacterized protein CCR75_007282 [Bremia lactucae]|uniref:Uncharacterized protein n=1 Tax=Bremia lactucae TaxID=4779 RepID=A0A976IKQ2_BRELC|nr:hypothetical protein CCR75_007282 [Bremia lactucae]